MTEHQSSPLAAAEVDAAVTRLIQARRARTDYFSPDLFSDPAWDILLILFQAKLRGEGLTPSALGDAISKPRSTADRWTKVLEQKGLVQRKGATCAAVATVELSARATSALGQWFELWPVGHGGSPGSPVTDLLGRIYGDRREGSLDVSKVD